MKNKKHNHFGPQINLEQNFFIKRKILKQKKTANFVNYVEAKTLRI